MNTFPLCMVTVPYQMDQNSDNLENGKQLGLVTCAVVLLTMNTCPDTLHSSLSHPFAASTTTSLRELATPTIGANATCHYYLSSKFALRRSKDTCRFAARTHKQETRHKAVQQLIRSTTISRYEETMTALSRHT